MFSPLEKKRYSEQVAQLIQEKILRDKLEKGARLPTERELAQEFQVSRTVIREALRELEVSGLIKIKKGHTGGIFIADAYHKPLRNSLKNLVSSGKVTVDQIFDVRLLIEPHIAMLAARRAKKEDIERLQALMKDSAQHQDDPNILKQNNLKFHLLLGKASGNPILSMLIESVIEILVEFSFDFLDLSFEKHFFRVHNDIVQVITQRKPEEAKRLIEQDVLEVKRKLEEFYGKS